MATPSVSVAQDSLTLFELDEHLIDLMDRIEEATAEGEDVRPDLLQEMTEYLDAFRLKVDRIAGYWRWQESIAAICDQEVERLSNRKRAAQNRVDRLRSMLLTFMLARGLKKLDGAKASIGMQRNSMASLLIDDPLVIADSYRETLVCLTKNEFQELLDRLPEGDLHQKLSTHFHGENWQINSGAVRASLAGGREVPGARLEKGHHVRLR